MLAAVGLSRKRGVKSSNLGGELKLIAVPPARIIACRAPLLWLLVSALRRRQRAADHAADCAVCHGHPSECRPKLRCTSSRRCSLRSTPMRSRSRQPKQLPPVIIATPSIMPAALCSPSGTVSQQLCVVQARASPRGRPSGGGLAGWSDTTSTATSPTRPVRWRRRSPCRPPSRSGHSCSRWAGHAPVSPPRSTLGAVERTGP